MGFECEGCGATGRDVECAYCGCLVRKAPPRRVVRGNMGDYENLKNTTLIGNMNTINGAVNCEIIGNMNKVTGACASTLVRGNMNDVKRT